MMSTALSERLSCAVLVFGVLLFPTASSAYTISLTGGSSGGMPGGQPLYEVSDLVEGDAFNISWGGVPGLSVTGMVIIESLTDTDADIRVMLDNLSTPTTGTGPRVTSVGFLIDNFSSLDNAANTGGTYLGTGAVPNPDIPGFTTSACAKDGPNCAGGGGGGIPALGSDDFTLEVSGNFLSTLTLSNFGLKIQAGPGGGSFELAGVPRPKVPEPATIGLLAIGVGLVLAGRRRSAHR